MKAQQLPSFQDRVHKALTFWGAEADEAQIRNLAELLQIFDEKNHNKTTSLRHDRRVLSIICKDFGLNFTHNTAPNRNSNRQVTIKENPLRNEQTNHRKTNYKPKRLKELTPLTVTIANKSKQPRTEPNHLEREQKINETDQLETEIQLHPESYDLD